MPISEAARGRADDYAGDMKMEMPPKAGHPAASMNGSQGYAALWRNCGTLSSSGNITVSRLVFKGLEAAAHHMMERDDARRR